MGKSKSNRSETAKSKKATTNLFASVDEKAFDTSVASLFASSLGPVQRPEKSRYQSAPEKQKTKNDEEDDEELSEAESEDSNAESAEEEDDEELSEVDEEIASEKSESDNEETETGQVLAKVRETVMHGNTEPKKRKRGNKEDDIEDAYMQKLAREEQKEEEKRRKKQKTNKAEAEEDDSDDEAGEDNDKASSSEDEEEESFVIPKHETETTTQSTPEEIEKASRTVFLGNVSNTAITSKSAKKTLLSHLSSFIPDLADNKPPHKVESLRFRSTAFTNSIPKKAAFAKKEVMDATTKSTNAYAVYSTVTAAREACRRLNGTVILDRHLRVDSVAHPAKVDNRRCVFVGNLGFVDDETSLPTPEGEAKKKSKPPSDVEEGLWVHFSKAGKVESVRVPRDAKTRVGKGFAYVQFYDENGVEAALQFNDQKFPPLLPRKLRVVRAKGMKPKKDNKPSTPAFGGNKKSKSVYNAKVTDEQKSLQGRAGRLLGKAGAFKSAESFIFEGHRAKPGVNGVKLGGKKKSGGKPKTRSSKRGAAWKAGGGKRKSDA
ncbi:hypothetical protein GQ43DRAFT_441827 [Delitschia confertaspora ATCC 74209]|uniref:Nucleolar protein 12 n=1 Tax=Delitschia confertaspora ATCC 74209 TaxID=1513339 RepID=A0A9P4JIU4_9PLEO|nr:hypothetical protein GQ43DRAFT_441827 [Delitschia confertaspora ATCC 74209]